MNPKPSLMTRLFLSLPGRATSMEDSGSEFVIQLQEKRERKQSNAKLASSKENFLLSSKKMIWYLQWA
ncbi:hypothetical protein PanWU01x14_233540 [Parasponia andersonii]|uniref:Uncharacterized protein n=1 Tax=Parasponia andersonii TaxID=3476 RepID=A0A2P5BJK8_PARAD|nr:hypothetical protein PanWU01x14_233540 [Parasponia andersonii]